MNNDTEEEPLSISPPEDELSPSNVTRDESIAADYLRGTTLTALSRQHRITRSRIRQILQEMGVRNKPPESHTPEAMKPPPLKVNGCRPLTARQKEILDFLMAYECQHGFSAAYRDIGERFGIRSTNAINDHLEALERKGYIKRGGIPGQARSIQILGNHPNGEVRSGTIVVERTQIVAALRMLESIQDWIPNGVHERFQSSLGSLRHIITKDLPDYAAERAARESKNQSSFIP